jgi:hypothetical protein
MRVCQVTQAYLPLVALIAGCAHLKNDLVVLVVLDVCGILAFSGVLVIARDDSSA